MSVHALLHERPQHWVGLEEGIDCFRVGLPAGGDVNDVAVAARNPIDVLGRALRTATWMGKGRADDPAACRRGRAGRGGAGCLLSRCRGRRRAAGRAPH
ncbi:MAG: hypothetical protein M3510_09435, partial [Actinomycetota bacterium]|nr:hypothetical protein [Actinomycetota bacterium]